MFLQKILLATLFSTSLALPSRTERQADPTFRISESMRMNMAHSREFSASFSSSGPDGSYTKQQSSIDYQNPNQGGLVNWQQTLGQFIPNVMKFNANYNNNFGPVNSAAFGFGPISLPMPSVNRGNNVQGTSTVGLPKVGGYTEGIRTTQKPMVESKPLGMVEKLSK